uniref:Uncharacterized protein n=1 Tax=Photinus pyralis TaxID=7054 RepID=A0A1Y1KU41_PHOPY
MAFLHAQSCECIKSELDLFALPATQTSIESGEWVFYKPLSSLTDDAPIEFVIPGSGNDYLDLSHTMLYITARIVKQDDSILGVGDVVGPANNWLHTLYSQVEICLNQKLVSPPNNTYAYRAYIETLLNYGLEAKTSHLGCSLWHNDTPKKMDTLTADNVGFTILTSSRSSRE